MSRSPFRFTSRRWHFRPVLQALETRALPSFAAPVGYTIGTQNQYYVPNAAPINVATGDFNGDTKLDLAVAHTADNTVSILINAGNGTFQPAVPYAIGEPIQGDVFVGYFDGDTKLDLFLPAGGTSNNNYTTHPVILRGNGDGTFQAPLVSSSFGPSRGWAIGEFNGDNKLDLVSTNPGAGTVSVLRGNGDGTFQAALVSPQLFGYSRWVTAADFNHDGKTDLAVANGIGHGLQTGNAQLTILLGNGNGTFHPGGNYASPQVGDEDATINPEDVTTADVNGDGQIDVIVSNYSYNINVYLGNGDGTFQPARGVTTGEYPRSVTVVDVNGDGKMDLVVANVGINQGGAEFAKEGPQPGSVAVLLGNGDGTYLAPIQYTPFEYPGWAAVGDFNGDNRPDLAVTRVRDGHTVNVMLNQPPTPHPIVVGAGAGGSPLVRVYDADGSLRFHFLAYSARFRGGVRVAAGDVNGDGVDDIITAAGPGGAPHVRVFDGKTSHEIRGFFAYAPAFTGGVWVAAGDVNNDGYADVITGAGAGGGPQVRVFDGKTGAILTGFFAYAPTFTGGVTVAAGDENGDLKAEIITGVESRGGPQVRVYNAATHAVVTQFMAFTPAYTGGIFVAAGDVTGDNWADIVVAQGQGPSPHVRTFRGDTGGFLRDAVPFGGSSTPNGLRVATIAPTGGGTVSVLVGAGRGFQPRVRTLNGATLQVLSDFNAFVPTFLGGILVG